MEKLFDKAIVFTDIHFGKKNNQEQHNVDCSTFVKWAISIGKRENVDVAIFCGDWHDNRQSLHVNTMNYSLSNIEEIANNFNQFFFIPGNHDLFYKENRNVTSVSIGRNIKNVTIINDFLKIGDVTFCPWLVGDDFSKIKKVASSSKYLFGHFEIGGFYMNSMVEMPNTDLIKVSDFNDCDMAFSGHFHKRQQKGRVNYIGNCFPHSYSDTWDDDRGVMILEWGKDLVYHKWQNAPKYRVFTMTDMLERPEELFDVNTYAKVTNDLRLPSEDLQLIKDIYVNQYGLRKLDILNVNKMLDEQDIEEDEEDMSFKTIDEIVINGLNSIDSNTYSTKTLIDIYNQLG
jgi:DNA repair exonuclease SbcCD nuclease subunit